MKTKTPEFDPKPEKWQKPKKRSPLKNAKSKPLTVHVHGGVLKIEVGIDLLAHAAIVRARQQDNFMLDVFDPAGFADDIAHVLSHEDEDGSTMITRVIDQAIDQTLDDGSLHAKTGFCPYPKLHHVSCSCNGDGGAR